MYLRPVCVIGVANPHEHISNPYAEVPIEEFRSIIKPSLIKEVIRKLQNWDHSTCHPSFIAFRLRPMIAITLASGVMSMAGMAMSRYSKYALSLALLLSVESFMLMT
jgi:hypothetical protein